MVVKSEWNISWNCVAEWTRSITYAEVAKSILFLCQTTAWWNEEFVMSMTAFSSQEWHFNSRLSPDFHQSMLVITAEAQYCPMTWKHAQSVRRNESKICHEFYGWLLTAIVVSPRAPCRNPSSVLHDPLMVPTNAVMTLVTRSDLKGPSGF